MQASFSLHELSLSAWTAKRSDSIQMIKPYIIAQQGHSMLGRRSKVEDSECERLCASQDVSLCGREQTERSINLDISFSWHSSQSQSSTSSITLILTSEKPRSSLLPSHPLLCAITSTFFFTHAALTKASTPTTTSISTATRTHTFLPTPLGQMQPRFDFAPYWHRAGP